MKKTLFKIFFTFVFFLSVSGIVAAADLNVDCTGSGCTKSGVDPLFNNSLDGSWYPGRNLTKTLNLKNSSPSSKEMDISPSRTSPSSILENVMQISVVTNPGGLVVWAGSLADFYNQSRINMGGFSSGVNQDYNFTASMNSSAGNDYQNLETVFDLTLGFWEEPATPTQTTSAGTVAGVSSPSAPTCGDQAPSSAPTILSVIPGVNSITLTWSEAGDPVSYYLVAYGTSPGVYSYGNANVGGKGTTSYTINGISGGVTYYLVVRAGNGCMPGPFSGEVSTTPGGGFIEGVPAGFAPNVLGEATQSATLKNESSGNTGGKIQGASTGLPCKKCKYLLSLIVEILLIVVYFRLLISKLNNKKRYSILIPMISFFIFYLLNKDCISSWIIINSTNLICRYFLFITLGIYSLSIVFSKKLSKLKE